jgi:heterotetrameric sarcosine oxidase delta subunit
MLLIPCPYCGPRALAEFTFERPMESVVPLDAEPAEAMQRLYSRDNPRGPSWELWRHAYGCRGWLTLQRDTATHDILECRLLEAGA